MVAHGWSGAVEMDSAMKAAGHPTMVLRGNRDSAFWAAWWTERPNLDPWVPPDAIGFVDGRFAHAEALGAADRAIRNGKGSRVYNFPVEPAILRRAFDNRAIRERSRAVDFDRAPETFAAIGLKPDATPAQVKKAFGRLVLKAHPDHGGTAEAFRELLKNREIALGVARARVRVANKDRARQRATRKREQASETSA